jgi:hypothetical protein
MNLSYVLLLGFLIGRTQSPNCVGCLVVGQFE